MKTNIISLLSVLFALGAACTTEVYNNTTIIMPTSPDAGATPSTLQPDSATTKTDLVGLDAGTDVMSALALDMGVDSIPSNTIKIDAGSILDAQPVVVYDAQAMDTISTDTTPVTAVEAGSAATFRIVLVNVDRVDAMGRLAEDVRSFGIKFSSPAKNIWLTINEKSTGAIFRWDPLMWDASSVLTTYVSPGNWTEKLKPNTTYIWSVKADAATPVTGAQSDAMVGEFTTAVCFPGQTRSCYGGLPETRGVGRCHDGTNACIAAISGSYWDSNCIGELTPYPFGDICGNGIDDDCNGKVDDSVQIEVSTGQDTIWSRTATDGDLLQFDMDAHNASSMHFYWLNIQVNRTNANVGYYHLKTLATDGSWTDITNDVIFYDASGGGYKAGGLDLGSNLYTAASNWFNLGIQWKDFVGPTIRSGGNIRFMLVGIINPEFTDKSASVRHYAPHSDSACGNATDGKTVMIN